MKKQEKLDQDPFKKTLGYCLFKAAAKSKAMLDEGLRPLELLTYQYAILRLLAHHGGVSQIDIGHFLHIDKASMVRYLDDLEGKSLIKKISSPSDRRIKTVQITEKGQKLYAKAEKVREKVQEEFLSPLSESERKAYSTIIPKLI